MRSWGTLVAAACIALTTSGCWLQVGGNAQRTGFQTETGVTAANVATLTPKWTTSLPAGTGSPVVDGGKVFVAGGSTMTALNGLTGAQVWQQTIPDESGFSVGLGNPAVVAAQIVVPYSVYLLGGTYTFNPNTGARTSTGPNQFHPIGAAAVANNATATAMFEGNSGGALFALSYAGKLGFVDFGSVGNIPSPSSPMILGNLAYISTRTSLLAFPLDSCPAGAPIAGYCAPAFTVDLGANAGMPVGMSPTRVAVPLTNGNVAVVDAATGTLQWTAVTGAAGATSPALTDTGAMLVGTSDGVVRSFPVAGCGTATCAPTWTSASAGAAISSQPVVGGNVVYVGTAAGKVVAFDAAGCASGPCPALISITVNAAATSTVAVVNGGLLFATTNNGTVAAYGLP